MRGRRDRAFLSRSFPGAVLETAPEAVLLTKGSTRTSPSEGQGRGKPPLRGGMAETQPLKLAAHSTAHTSMLRRYL